MSAELDELEKNIMLVETNLPFVTGLDENIVINEYHNTFNYYVLYSIPKEFPSKYTDTWISYFSGNLKEYTTYSLKEYVSNRSTTLQKYIVEFTDVPLDDHTTKVVKDTITHVEVAMDKANIRLIELLKLKYNSELDRIKTKRDLTLKATTIVKAINAEIKS